MRTIQNKIIKKLTDFLFLFKIRPVTVTEGAHVQWEVELLGFEMPKVIILPFLNNIPFRVTVIICKVLYCCFSLKSVCLDFQVPS